MPYHYLLFILVGAMILFSIIKKMLFVAVLALILLFAYYIGLLDHLYYFIEPLWESIVNWWSGDPRAGMSMFVHHLFLL